MALQSLADTKTYLGISNTDFDDFLTDQGEIISDAIETYCSRKFLSASYVQEIYRNELNDEWFREIYLYHYPLISISSVQINGTAETSYRKNDKLGRIYKNEGWFSGIYDASDDDKIEISYTAGYSTLPALIRSAYQNLINQAYSKKLAGVQLDFGNNVQRLSVPGTIAIDYDYTLDNNTRKRGLGAIIGDQANILDLFRSERALLGIVRPDNVS